MHTGSPCTHQECKYLRAHGSPTCSCGGMRHAIDSNWDGYSFGHAGGHVAFLTACQKCGDINTGHVLGVSWSPEQMARARAFRGSGQEPVV